MKGVYFQIDNTTALLNFVKIGGTGNQTLLKLSKETWKYLLKYQITINAEYLLSLLAHQIGNLETAGTLQNGNFAQKYFNKPVRGGECPK